MPNVGKLLLVLFPLLGQELTLQERSKITIIDDDKLVPYERTYFDAGPATGDMLNWHYFPGIILYNAGQYTRAEQEFTYVIDRPYYLTQNPRRDEFMSVSYYLRGMIYFYHADGFGRYTAAKEDFQASLKWNPRNYIVYIELARLYSLLGFKNQAAELLRHLLESMPDEKIADEARKQLGTLENPSSTSAKAPGQTLSQPQP